uniref:Uncharacterized protein n=1 Tax=viral metagenome TaxID=1070528 RepID=A0A6C0JA56_9ZZZZ
MTKLKLAFILMCIPCRILIALTPLLVPLYILPYMSIMLFIIGLSFTVLYVGNLRLNAFEGGGNTWWANYRIIHAALYLSAALLALNKQRIAWVPLTADVVLGLLLFIMKQTNSLPN